ncbi:helix-turn-helix transcriptional regulator [Mycobacterium sp. KBS0706]|uniref:helix-turn-helix domain-containing protein n=1 Tax=Mycobacterium sp. KBS0706 TaxID=2578109 RepID=UPI00110F700A|nr:helix-turn-helix transcriptional regulator [Mycobacterium sp. KBS0706]TSD89093.1 helix-turn-helix transcriptional regulator [Mycobacterium sp. KBS0706]
MTILRDYLQVRGISPAEFARQIGRDRKTVHRWVSGERIPRPPEMAKIRDATGGEVTANDFYAARETAA